jgi:membrane-bound lytic murein transglycosylase F
LQESLDAGLVDIVLSIDNILEKEFPENLKLTVPWGISRQQVIIRSNTASMKGIRDLTTRQISIKRSSPAWSTMGELAQDYKGMDLLIIPESEPEHAILEKISSGKYDLAIMDSQVTEDKLDSFLDLEVAFNLTDDVPKNWGVPSSKTGLRLSLNSFLNNNHLAQGIANVYREDLPDLKLRNRLRLITFQDATNYFVNKSKLQGFEYELLNRFSKSQGMRLDVVIAKTQDDAQQLLLEGKGDVIAASIPKDSFDNNNSSIAYTNAYSYAAPLIEGRSHDYPLLDIRDLAGRRIVLPPESPYRKMLLRIKDKGIDLEIVSSAESNLHDTLFQVSQGNYDLTVIGSQQRNTDFTKHINLKVHFSLEDPTPNSWVVRNSDTQLMTALNDYIQKEFRKSFYNVVYAKYIESPAKRRSDNVSIAGIERLSPYDDIVFEYATKYGFDWRLVLAQMYTESQFNPNAESTVGARGLMQLMPATAVAYGVEDLNDPSSNLDAGVKYMNHLRGRFNEDLSPEDRIWFTLASYNAGYSRVKRGRVLAAKMGLDPDRWFNHVEKAMLVLARPYMDDGEMKRYCRCGQTAHYVREIKTLYSNYVRLTQSGSVVAKSSPNKTALN